MGRFKERDPNVKLTVLETTRLLLEKTQVESLELLRTRADVLVSQLDKQLKAKRSSDISSALFAVISALCVVCSGQLESYFSILLPHVTAAVTVEDASLQSHGLTLLAVIVNSHTTEQLGSHLAGVAEVACKAAGDHYLKVKTLALRLCGAVADKLSHEGNDDLVRAMYKASMTQLELQDVDQDVKEASLSAVASIISCFGDVLKAEVPHCLPVITGRFSNELTRMSALRAISEIARSRLDIDMSPAHPSLAALCEVLRKDSQSLRHQTLETLCALIEGHAGGKMTKEQYKLLLDEASNLIVEGDLHAAQLALQLVVAVVEKHPAVPAASALKILGRVVVFIKSPLLQGNVLAAVVDLFCCFLRTSNKDLTYDKLLKILMKSVDASFSFRSCTTVAKCVGAMARTGTQEQATATINQFSKLSQSEQGKDTRLALLILGAIGREQDLSSHKLVDEVILAGLQSDSEEVSNAASLALGNIAVGNVQKYLPFIVGLIEKQVDQRYLLLAALRQLLKEPSHSADLGGHAVKVLGLLMELAESEEESVKGMVAACLAVLAVINGPSVVPLIHELTQATGSTARRWVGAAVFRFLSHHSDGVMEPTTDKTSTQANTVSENTSLGSAQQVLEQALPSVVQLLTDVDLEVKRQCVLGISALAHASSPQLLPHLPTTVLPALYAETTSNPTLVRVVEFGPFKHEIDDGLPLRKSAFQALDIVIEHCPSVVQIEPLAECIAKGLVDHADIQTITYAMLLHLATSNNAQHLPSLFQVLDSLQKAMLKGVTGKIKEAKREETAERAKDTLRTAVRTMNTLNQIPGVAVCEKFCHFFSRVKKTNLLEKMLLEMEA